MRNDSNAAIPARAAIDPAEYDFSDVPDNELKGCLYYELIRESKTIVREVKNVRLQMSAEAKRQNLKPGGIVMGTYTITKVTDHPGIVLEATLITILAGLPVFPDLPWQKLPEADKQRLRNLRGKAIRSHNKFVSKAVPRLVIHTISNDPSLGETTLKVWSENKRPEWWDRKTLNPEVKKLLVSGFVRIDLGYTHEQLIEGFRQWLKVNHPEDLQPVKERRGRHTERDPLNALGALRLRYHCRTLNEAQKLIAPLASKRHGMSYSDRTAWKRACASAVKHFRALLKLPDGQLPIHFTKGWRK